MHHLRLKNSLLFASTALALFTAFIVDRANLHAESPEYGESKLFPSKPPVMKPLLMPKATLAPATTPARTQNKTKLISAGIGIASDYSQSFRTTGNPEDLIYRHNPLFTLPSLWDENSFEMGLNVRYASKKIHYGNLPIYSTWDHGHFDTHYESTLWGIPADLCLRGQNNGFGLFFKLKF